MVSIVKIGFLVASFAALAACKSEDYAGTDGSLPRATAAANANDTRVAKDVFGHIPFASSQRTEVIGSYSRGCLAGGVELAENGPTWQAMRLSRNRNWSHPMTIDYVQDLSRFAATQPGWEGLYIGDMSQPRGGPMLTGHVSHQSGLDVDIWMLPPTRLDLTVQERENLSSISTRRAGGAYTNDNWTTGHMEVLRAAASDPRTARIFVFPGAKVAMCNWATGDRSWLRKIRPLHGHHYHFHVRLNCPEGDRSCEEQSPIPAGDGCADAQVWVDNILNPPPPVPNPNPTPTPSRGPTRMADLPAQCLSVSASN